MFLLHGCIESEIEKLDTPNIRLYTADWADIHVYVSSYALSRGACLSHPITLVKPVRHVEQMSQLARGSCFHFGRYELCLVDGTSCPLLPASKYAKRHVEEENNKQHGKQQTNNAHPFVMKQEAFETCLESHGKLPAVEDIVGEMSRSPKRSRAH